MQNLLNGSYFDRILKKLHEELQEKYSIEKIDVKIIKNMRQGMTYSFLKDLIEIGVYDERELENSITRLQKQGVIKLSKLDNVQDVTFKLTHKGAELWKQIQSEYDHANDVLFKGMTEEQVETYKRLSQMVIDNINREVIKKD